MFKDKIKFVYGSEFHQLCQELFYVLSGALVLFILLEIVKPQIVVAYLNISFWLLLWLLNGMILLMFEKKK